MNIIAVRAPDLKGSLVGESEEKTQKLLDMAEANGPCIVFIDEAEKLLGSQESTRDGGAHDAVLAQFLSFMQDNEAGVYFIFTANQMNKFPPELIDRFEGRWFVDLPSDEERDNICRIHLNLNASEANGLDDIESDEKAMASLVTMSTGYSGRNIEQAIEEAMDIAFDDGRRKVVPDDFKVVFSEMKPTSETKKAEIEAMREFVANGTMRKANTPTEDEANSGFVAHRGFA
jgi:SpoVK/Ycf46/Vps4 family AAA+-type ATPase